MWSYTDVTSTRQLRMYVGENGDDKNTFYRVGTVSFEKLTTWEKFY